MLLLSQSFKEKQNVESIFTQKKKIRPVFEADMVVI